MKYIEFAKKVNKEQDLDERIEETASILKDKLEAKIAMQRAMITESKSKLRAAEKAVEAAKGKLTEDISDYLSGVFDAMDELDKERERFGDKETVLKDLISLSELF